VTGSIVRPIEHHGLQLLFADMGGSDRADMLERIAALRAAVAACPPGSALVLGDYRKAALDPVVIGALGEVATANKPHVRASAVVGLVPKREEIRQLIAGMAAREIRSFDDVTLAMDWLAEQGLAAAGGERVR